MGGYFSGRRDGGPCTDEFLRLDVRRLHRDQLLQSGMSYRWQWGDKRTVDIQVEADQIRLIYRSRSPGDEWQDQHCPVRLERTPCHYGGHRVWFHCPVIGCGRRVAVLYGRHIFACRQCHRLVYRCQRESDDDQLARRIDKIRKRLEWEPGFLNGSGGKPKGMHWRTFWRLRMEHDRCVEACLVGFNERFKALGLSRKK